MSTLDIPPHSKRLSRLALGLLALVAVASFAAGFLRQPDLAAPPPPAPTDASGSAIAEARAIDPSLLQVAQAPRPRRAAAAPVDLTDALPDPTAPTSQAAPAVDAAATAPDAPPAPAKPPVAPPPADPPS